MTTHPIVRAAALVAGTLALFVSCGGDPTGPGAQVPPTPGELRVRLAMPRASEGAVLLAISGPAVPGGIATAQPGVIVQTRQAGGVTTVALFGSVAAGEVLRMTVPDVRAASGYAATVREVAGEDNALRDDLTAYRATVTVPDR